MRGGRREEGGRTEEEKGEGSQEEPHVVQVLSPTSSPWGFTDLGKTHKPRTEPGTLAGCETSWARVLETICILGPALPVLPLETQPSWEAGTASQHIMTLKAR